VVASELMPYAMTRPVIETALAPLSLSKKCILRARARASRRGRVGGILGYRTGGVERPHGLDCIEKIRQRMVSSIEHIL